MNKFNEKNFNKTYIPTIGVDFSIRTVKIDDERIKLQIWDTVNFNRSFRFCYDSHFMYTSNISIVFP